MAELTPFPTRQPPPRLNALSALPEPDPRHWAAKFARLREFGHRNHASPLEGTTSEELQIRGPRTCPHAPPQGEGNNEPPRLRRRRPCHHAPPPGEENLLGLQQRFKRLTEAMREATDRMRAMDHMCEMMARQRASSRNEEDPDQAPLDQTLPDQAVLDHVREMMARQRAPSVNVENPDQAPLDQTLPDQAGLIAEGDVPNQEPSGCGLPDARTRPCPH